jgi:molybdopterin synthase catalytic subunit
MSDNVLALISAEPIDAIAIEDFVMDAQKGALVTFRGVVRNHDHGLAVTSLEYSAHPDAAQFLRDCCETIAAETGLRVAAAHRGEAFAACERLVDLIKQTVPIWKRQHLADGATQWVGL